MSGIHQVLVAASAGDAVTNAALDLRVGLRRHGRSEIFAAFVDPTLEGEAHPLGEFRRRGTGADLLVLHASIGEPAVAEFLAGRPEALAVVYHNVSPPAAFEPWDRAFARLLERGRHELAELAGRARVAVGVSPFNAAELTAMGFLRVGVAPMAVDPEALLGTEGDRSLAAELAGLDGPSVLYVGQLLPHKRIDWLLMAYHVLATYLAPEAHLIVVGADRLPSYGAALRQMVRELGLLRAHLVGSVTQAELVTYYRHADVFITASEHEGFCVPLLEAMAFAVPVLARSFGAIPDTMGGGGLLLGPEDGPLVAAEALAAMLFDPDLRANLVTRGRHRLASHDPEQARAQMLDHLLAAVPA
ncbi:MAG: glycosyltransferase [Acidimicrobiales bacterium]